MFVPVLLIVLLLIDGRFMKEFGINDEMEGDSLESKLNFTQTRIDNKIERWLLMVKNIERIFTKYSRDTNVFSLVCIVIVSC